MVATRSHFHALVVAVTLAVMVQDHGYISVPKWEYTFVGGTTRFMAITEASRSGSADLVPEGTHHGLGQGDLFGLYHGVWIYEPGQNRNRFRGPTSSGPMAAGRALPPYTRVLARSGATTPECSSPVRSPNVYWLVVHSATWLVYTNGAALEKMTSTGAKSKYAVSGSSSAETTTGIESSADSTSTSDGTARTATEALLPQKSP
ncbi:hypothetical protein ON010_g15089 [Phytophthora cinnamomi]|nr:hypothetical protein ON010_g15089 [Phytophthora cinnamomi]